MSTATAPNKYEQLAKLNVNDKTEKKNGLTYLSWAWAVDQLLRHDPSATWEYKEPARWGETVMVFCTVHAFGKQMTAQLPVMDHRNKAIPNPDAFQVNVAMQRCLAKAISLHGIGLYIYAGEDLPDGADEKPSGTPLTNLPPQWNEWTRNEQGENRSSLGSAALREWWATLSVDEKKTLKPKLDSDWKGNAEKADKK